MKTWKALLGVGLACAACCALPLFGAVLATGAGSLLLARVDGVLALLALLALSLLAGGLRWRYLRNRSPACAECPEGGSPQGQQPSPCACDKSCRV